LTASPEEIASTLQVEVNRVRGVLEELQDLDPPGIGARTVQECLLLQLQRLERQGIIIPSATQAIIQDHLEALGHHRFEHIRHALGISREDVQAAFLFIRTNLHPYPAHHYYDASSDPQSTRLRVRPSVLIHRKPTEPPGYEVEVVELQRLLVRVNPLYQQLHQQPHQISIDERKHVGHFLERARFFMNALQRRHDLLQRLVTYLVTFQQDFLERGPLYLRHLTQTDVARELGIHASTVSRATSGKFAQLPSQRLLPLQTFFASETRVQNLIRQIIFQETRPLSDEQIARRLREHQGITISRQMVANYRADLKIPAARQRVLLQHGKRNNR
jgi:RNA polymerase sigma-54 factor